jgi:2-methylisocitrate lyase-like PEP mutase family enzyme
MPLHPGIDAATEIIRARSRDSRRRYLDRIAAAAEAARAMKRDFVLTARAENFLWGRPDLDDTIRRLQAFEQAGADVLYAPGLAEISAV